MIQLNAIRKKKYESLKFLFELNSRVDYDGFNRRDSHRETVKAYIIDEHTFSKSYYSSVKIHVNV